MARATELAAGPGAHRLSHLDRNELPSLDRNELPSSVGEGWPSCRKKERPEPGRLPLLGSFTIRGCEYSAGAWPRLESPVSISDG